MSSISTCRALTGEQDSRLPVPAPQQAKNDGPPLNTMASKQPPSVNESEVPICATWKFDGLQDAKDLPREDIGDARASSWGETSPNTFHPHHIDTPRSRHDSMPELVDNIDEHRHDDFSGGPSTLDPCKEPNGLSFSSPFSASWGSTPAPSNNSARSDSPLPSPSLQPPQSAQQDISRQDADDSLQLVLKHIHELSHKVDNNIGFLYDGIQLVLQHIHDSDRERNKYQATARKVHNIMCDRLTNIIGNSAIAYERAEAASKIQESISRRLTNLIDMEIEDNSEATEKADPLSKALDNISQRVTSLIDQVLEDLPGILIERGYVCCCGSGKGRGAEQDVGLRREQTPQRGPSSTGETLPSAAPPRARRSCLYSRRRGFGHGREMAR